MSQVKPINKVLVAIPKAFEEEIATESGFKLYKDASYQKEWNATITGHVAIMSDLVSEESRPIFDEIDLGLEVAVDYKVVADFEYISDQKHFHQVSPENITHLKKYVNKEGQWINLRSIPNPKGVVATRIFSLSGSNAKATQEKIWVGWLQDKYMNTIDSVQGDVSDIEKWMAQFSFGKTDAFYFKNKIYVDKNPYWVVSYDQILAKKVQGTWKALGNLVLMKPLMVDVTKRVSLTAGGIHIPEGSIQMRFYDRAIHLNGCEHMGIRPGEVVAFDERFLIKYNLDGQEYFMIKNNHINGIYPQS